jgi:YggT family protein
MSQFLILLSDMIVNAISIYSILLIIYILMSWIPSTRETAFGQFLGKITEPYLGIFRKFIPPLGMIDISPIIGIFALRYIAMGVKVVFNMMIT